MKTNLKIRHTLMLFILFVAFLAAPRAHAATGEASLMMGFSKTDYGNGTYSSNKRLTASAAYNLTSMTLIELSFTDTRSFFNYDPIQTTKVNEQVLAVTLVQLIVPSTWVVQPYVKGGGAQYNRKQSGTIGGIPVREVETKSPSLVLGGGVRVFLLQNFSLKAEGVTYLPDFDFEQANDNFSVTVGVGVNF